MQKLVLVGLGGFIGTVGRYAIGGWIVRLKSGSTFPVETLLINIIGCLLIGFLAGLAETRGLFAGTTRAFLLAGVLGGFTTFSSFGYETVQLLREGQLAAAAVSVTLQLILGLGAVWAGDAGARLLGGV